MTLKEKVAEVNPECVCEHSEGGVKGCPLYYEYLNSKNDVTNCGNGNCEECWNQEHVENPVETMSLGSDINVLSKYEAASNYLFKKSVEESDEKDILITLQTALNYAHEKGKV